MDLLSSFRQMLGEYTRFEANHDCFLPLYFQSILHPQLFHATQFTLIKRVVVSIDFRVLVVLIPGIS